MYVLFQVAWLVLGLTLYAQVHNHNLKSAFALCEYSKPHLFPDNQPEKHNTVQPALSDHFWARKKWSLNRGGLLLEVKTHGITIVGT